MPGDVEGFEEVTIRFGDAKSPLRYVLVGSKLSKSSRRESVLLEGNDVLLHSDMDGWGEIIISDSELCSLE